MDAWRIVAPQKRLYYQVVFGAANMDVALTALLTKYGDSRVEHFPTRASVPLGVLLVDKNGVPAEPLSIGLSSFAWGVSTALKASLSKLSDWKEIEASFTGAVERYLRDSLTDEHGKTRPLDHGTITGVFEMLCRTIDLPSEFFEPPSFAIRTFVYFREKNLPELMLLNSFFPCGSSRSSTRSRFKDGSRELKALFRGFVSSAAKDRFIRGYRCAAECG